MKDHALRGRVAEIFSQADEVNKKSGKRFYTMTEIEGHKLVEYGIYDYFTKKYVLFDCYSRDIEKHLTEMESFINTPLTRSKA